MRLDSSPPSLQDRSWDGQKIPRARDRRGLVKPRLVSLILGRHEITEQDTLGLPDSLENVDGTECLEIPRVGDRRGLIPPQRVHRFRAEQARVQSPFGKRSALKKGGLRRSDYSATPQPWSTTRYQPRLSPVRAQSLVNDQIPTKAEHASKSKSPIRTLAGTSGRPMGSQHHHWQARVQSPGSKRSARQTGGLRRSALAYDQIPTKANEGLSRRGAVPRTTARPLKRLSRLPAQHHHQPGHDHPQVHYPNFMPGCLHAQEDKYPTR